MITDVSLKVEIAKDNIKFRQFFKEITLTLSLMPKIPKWSDTLFCVFLFFVFFHTTANDFESDYNS